MVCAYAHVCSNEELDPVLCVCVNEQTRALRGEGMERNFAIPIIVLLFLLSFLRNAPDAPPLCAALPYTSWFGEKLCRQSRLATW